MMRCLPHYSPDMELPAMGIAKYLFRPQPIEHPRTYVFAILPPGHRRAGCPQDAQRANPENMNPPYPCDLTVRVIQDGTIYHTATTPVIIEDPFEQVQAMETPGIREAWEQMRRYLDEVP